MPNGASTGPPSTAKVDGDRDEADGEGRHQPLRHAEEIAALPGQQRAERHGEQQRHEQRPEGQLKNGAPTEIFSPVSASSASG